MRSARFLVTALIAVTVGSTVCEASKADDRNSTCGFCKELAGLTFRFVRDKEAEQKLTKSLQWLCTMLYGPDTPALDNCKDNAATQAKQWYDELVARTDPEVICLMLKQCPEQSGASTKADRQSSSATNAKQEPSLGEKHQESYVNSFRQLIRLAQPGKLIEDKLEFRQVDASLNGGLRLHRGKTISNVKFSDYLPDAQLNLDPKPMTLAPCNQCEYLVELLDEYISTHPVEQDLVSLATKVCAKAPASTRTECTVFIESFGYEIIQDISGMKSPHEVCAKIHLC